MIWPEAHSSFASCGRPKTSSIYRDPPRTRQRTLILAAFLPWGGSDDTVTRRTGPQHTRFRPARAAATRRSASPQDCTPPTCRGAGAQHQDRAWLRCWWAAARPGRASRRRAEPHVERVPPVWRAPEGAAAVPVGGGGAWPGIETTHPGAAGVEGAGGSGGHGRASRSTTPSRRLACGDLAGGRDLRRPEHQRSPQHEGIPPAVALISYLVPLIFPYRGKRAGNSRGSNPSERRSLC